MDIKLHANARTTPAVRAYIQRSPKTGLALARELGVSVQTVYKWRKADRVLDGSHARHNLGQSTSPLHEKVILELRVRVGLSLDDIVEVMNRCFKESFSRSAIHRCLVRLGVNRLPKEKAARSVGKFEEAPCGFIHIDLKGLKCLGGHRSYVFVAIDRATRFVWVRVIRRRDQHTLSRCLEAFLAEFKHPVHTIVTDNEGGFTDRCAVDKKGKPANRPSGRHPFDVVCRQHGIEHRLIRPYHPQTNGMVERFNRRLNEAIKGRPAMPGRGSKKFASHDERDAFVHNFVANYNLTRLKCLDYKAPIEMLCNLAEQYTKGRGGQSDVGFALTPASATSSMSRGALF